MSSIPFKTAEPNSTRAQASIGKAVKIDGQICSKEDLYVDGDVEGTIELQEHRLTIGPNGKVHANIKAREVVIFGNVQGNVEARDSLDLARPALAIASTSRCRRDSNSGPLGGGPPRSRALATRRPASNASRKRRVDSMSAAVP